MSHFTKEKDYFISSPIMFVNDNNKQKTLSIPIVNSNNYCSDTVSKSWGGYDFLEKRRNNIKKFSISPSDDIRNINKYKKSQSDIFPSDFKPYDAVSNCKSAGVIPYAIHNDTVYFLFQQTINPQRKKDSGWNDFGGKKIDPNESTAETAAREFSEETSCLFYLKEKNNENSKKNYEILKDNSNLHYSEDTIKILKGLIIESQKHYADKITEFVLPIYISSKETYISYLVHVDYIPEEDLPRAEDIHIPYESRYLRVCRWFTFDELMELHEKDFHKRLQITRIQQRINNYYDRGLFS
jgi:8-oxo-dGTP pyrophosphatase MutT (NUDIX family)